MVMIPAETILNAEAEAKDRAAARARDDWQPIETAPKDGTRVLVWHPYWNAASTAQWYGTDWRIVYDLKPFVSQPTHWRPLPAPPRL